MTRAGALAAGAFALGSASAVAGEAPRSVRPVAPCPDNTAFAGRTGACVRIGGSVSATASLRSPTRAGLLTLSGRLMAEVTVPTEIGTARAVAALRYRWAVSRR